MLAPNTIRNAMTVDVEDYFHVSVFEKHIDRADWESLPSRVERNTDRVLDLFAAHDVTATFFMLGWVAERYPDLTRRIHAAGHEIASHGYAHVRATTQTRDEFTEDVGSTKKLLEDITGAPVHGFRAASFSIREENLWALDALAEAGYRYSSSIYPVRHDLYGIPHAPRFAFRHGETRLLEIPVSTVTVAGHNLPCGGGGYFRLLPYAYTRWALRRITSRERQPVVFYFHPWEIDPHQPKQEGLGARTRVRHYLNLHRTERRLHRLLGDFRWDRMDRIFLEPESEGNRDASGVAAPSVSSLEDVGD